MSDNEDLLCDDLGDHSLADYNLGNEEEEQLLADDYDSSSSQNVPTSISAYREPVDIVPTGQGIEFNTPSIYPQTETESVVPNIVVEVTNTPEQTYPAFKEYEEHTVPPAIPAAAVESPQIVPSEVPPAPKTNAQRSPRTRNIPDSLDKVFVPRTNSFNGRGRNSWRNPHYRQSHPYRRNNTFRGNFNQRPSFPPPQIRLQLPNTPQIRPEIRPEIPQMAPEISPERPIPQENHPAENRFNHNQNFPRFQFRDDRPHFGQNVPPNFDRPMFYQQYGPRQFAPRDVMNSLPHLRQPLPVLPVNLPKGREPEVRMLPVLPPNLPNLPPGGLAGKKVLINPHFKGNFQPPVEGIPTYIPTRIQKTPPLSPTLESKFGPIKDIDDAAERFIAEQRNALARAANRKMPRRSPQRYIENTTIEIENDLARSCEERELLRRQEEFINANRAGLRRRMRSPTPPPRSPSPRRSPERRPRLSDEESEYRRRVREQESLRERVLRAKELRRRRGAARDREKDRQDKELPKPEIKQEKPIETKEEKPTTTITYNSDTQQEKPDTTRKTPERETERVEKEMERELKRDRSPIRIVESAEANSTCETLTPPHGPPSPPCALTPPLPAPPAPPAPAAPALSDDDVDLILDDIDDILSDDDDSGRFKDKAKEEKSKPVTKQVDLRSKLPPKAAEAKKPRQKIIFNDNNDDKKKKDKSPVRRAVLGSNKNINIEKTEAKIEKAKIKVEVTNMASIKLRQKIIFDNKEVSNTKVEKAKEKPKELDEKRSQAFPSRRVVIRKADKSVFSRIDSDPTRPSACIFSRAVRTAITAGPPAPAQAPAPPAGPAQAPAGATAAVRNLPPGMTDTRLRTLAADSQSLTLDREERSAIITFKTVTAAETFKRKFNNKMVAASRLTVTLQ